jgi:hypothetical protein
LGVIGTAEIGGFVGKVVFGDGVMGNVVVGVTVGR